MTVTPVRGNLPVVDEVENCRFAGQPGLPGRYLKIMTACRWMSTGRQGHGPIFGDGEYDNVDFRLVVDPGPQHPARDTAGKGVRGLITCVSALNL